MVAGALLAIGIVNSGVQNENDPAFALIYDYVSHEDPNIRWGGWQRCALVITMLIKIVNVDLWSMTTSATRTSAYKWCERQRGALRGSGVPCVVLECLAWCWGASRGGW